VNNRIRTRLAFFVALWLSGAASAHSADLYVPAQGTSSSTGLIYDISPAGGVSSFVGGLSFPRGIAIDSSGNVFVGDFSAKIFKFTPSGHLSIFASNVFPFGLAFAPNGNLFEADGNGVINEFTPAGVESTFATGLANVQGIACDAKGDVFLADGQNSIFKYTPSGSRSTFASGLNGPVGLAFDPSGNLFASAELAGTIYKFTPNGVRSTFASGLTSPWGLACDAKGDVYDAETTTGIIYEFSPSGARSTFASGLAGPNLMSFNPPTAIPEPSSLFLMIGGTFGLIWRLARQDRKRQTGQKKGSELLNLDGASKFD
jgi:sugar lactone lactonase YvrE